MCKKIFYKSVICLLVLGQKVNTSSTSGHRLTETCKFDTKVPKNALGDFKLVIPESCKDSNICEHIPDYPQQFVDGLLLKLIDAFPVLNEDFELEIPSLPYNETAESDQLCKPKRKLFNLQAARSKRNTWHLVLSAPLYPQTFVGEVCSPDVNEHKSTCSTAIVLMDYHGKCVQKYVQRKMLALNEEMNKMEIISIDVPSCCSCDLFRM